MTTAVHAGPSSSRPLSGPELQQIRDRCARATPGPWVAIRESDVLGTLGGPVCRMDADEAVVVGTPTDCGPTHDAADDAQFIAQARTDVERLLDLVERLAGQLASAQICILVPPGPGG